MSLLEFPVPVSLLLCMKFCTKTCLLALKCVNARMHRSIAKNSSALSMSGGSFSSIILLLVEYLVPIPPHILAHGPMSVTYSHLNRNLVPAVGVLVDFHSTVKVVVVRLVRATAKLPWKCTFCQRSM